MGSELYVPNELDKEFDEFWSRVSCYAVVIFPFDQRCDFVNHANSCIYGTNVVPYIQLMACHLRCRNQFEEYVYVTLFLFLCLELFCCMTYVIHNYYGPALKLLSRMMHMSEHLAGVTILSLGYGLPEVIANVWSINDDVESHFANKMAAGLYLTTFVGGLVCYISPFKLSGATTIRDLLYIVLCVILLEYFIKQKKQITLDECIILILVYLSYLVVSVVDLLILRRTAKMLLIQIQKLEQTDTDNMKRGEVISLIERIDKLRKQYDKLSEDGVVDILARGSTLQKPDEAFFTYLTRRSERRPSLTSKRMKRSVVYRGFRNKNRHLFKQFFSSLKPVYMDDWIKGNILKRMFYIIRAPVVILCAIYIPLVDYEQERDGWSKLLNCIQIFLNPALTIVLGAALIYREKSRLWYLNIPDFAMYGVYSMIITVPLAIMVFIDSSTLVPPKYHIAFSIMNFSGSVFLAMQCSYELSLFMKVIGSIYEVPFDFMGVTLLAVSTCMTDLVISVSLCLQGYEKMAYAATLGTIFLNVIIGCTTLFLAPLVRGQIISSEKIMGNYADNAFITLLIGLGLTMLWMMMLDFNARRSVGIFSMTIFGIFVLFAVLIKRGIIHSFSADRQVKDAYATFEIGVLYKIMDVTVYEENDLDKDFANFWNDVSCYAVVRFPYDERCEFVKKANSCVYGTNFVPYMRLLACDFKCKNRFEEHAFVSFFMILSFMLLLCTGHVAAVYYSPALKVISRILHMNDHLAGVTIMALCNTIPDLLYQLVIVNDREWIFASDVGRSLFVVMFVGGLVCYMTSFKMHPFNTVRDLLFLLFGTLLLEYSLIANVEILSMITVYVIYLVVNGLDLILIKYTLAVLRRELQQLTETTNSLENAERIKYLTDQIYKLSKEERVQILKRRTTNARHNNFTYLTQSPNTHEKVEIQLFRTTRYSRMNTGLFKEFFFAMKPINVEDWRDANTVVRAFYLVRAPIVVMCAIYIPLVNYEEQKNGWCKLLNCIQIFLNPAITIILGKSLMFRRKDEFWYASVPRNSKYGLYSIIVTVPLAIFVFCHSDTRAPPKYHALFTILNMSGSVFIIFQCNYELRVIFEMVGFLYDVTDEFMNSTVIAVVSSLDDLTTIVTMALHGYEKMAYAAAIGGPLFYVLLHVGSLIAVKKAVNQNVSLNSIMGSYGGLLYVIFTLGIMMTLLWTTLLNFHTRRSVGVFSMSIFGVYMIFAVLINKGLISPYKHEELVYDASKH